MIFFQIRDKHKTIYINVIYIRNFKIQNCDVYEIIFLKSPNFDIANLLDFAKFAKFSNLV